MLSRGLARLTNSLQARLIVFAAVIIVATSIATAGIGLSVFAVDSQVAQRERVMRDVEAAAAALVDDVQNGRTPDEGAFLNRLGSFPIYRHFVLVDLVRDRVSGPVAGNGVAPKPTDPVVRRVAATGRPFLLAEGGEIRMLRPLFANGAVVAIVDADAVTGMSWGKIGQIAGAAGMTAVLMAFLFLPPGLWFARQIAAPLRRLTLAARSLKNGAWEPHTAASDPREVSELTGTIDGLLSQVREDMGEIRRLAFTDSVTKLGNRDRFRFVLESSLKHFQSTGIARALFCIDIHNFRQVNEIYGHARGDEVLLLLAKAFADVCQSHGFNQCDPTKPWKDYPPEVRLAGINRHAGDEFMVILRGHTGPAELARVAESLCDAARLCLDSEATSIQIGASVGIVVFEPGMRSASEIVRFADLAMAEARRAGRNRYAFFTPELDQRSRDKLHLEMELRRAIREREFVLRYMPQVQLKGEHCDTVEALVRWQHPTKGLLSPGAFIALAETTGLIVDIDRFVLDEACRQAAEWARLGQRIRVSVNVSLADFQQADFVDTVLNALERHDLDAELLELELTESIAMTNPSRVAAIVTQLRAVGIRFAIDDFGTGYSNLGHLTTLSFDVLKIDQSFVRGLAGRGHTDARIIVETILSLAQNLGVTTVAEGVETREQADYLRCLGCTMGQGYYFGRPMEPAAFLSRFALRGGADRIALAS